MKFQNCILINFVTDGRTHARTDKLKAICPFNFFQSWGHNKLGRGSPKADLCQIISKSVM